MADSASLTRLAVSIPWQGKHVGAGLLEDAMLRTLAAADMPWSCTRGTRWRIFGHRYQSIDDTFV
jgi:hypothetical protein